MQIIDFLKANEGLIKFNLLFILTDLTVWRLALNAQHTKRLVTIKIPDSQARFLYKALVIIAIILTLFTLLSIYTSFTTPAWLFYGYRN
jgi:energy-coupling factor transporter transmembrane protein EcfT